MYYKAGANPWKLASVREGVCYVGIAFKRSGKDKFSKTAACAAQMFLDDGDGIVFLGDEGPWYSPKRNQYHLDKPAAKKLLRGMLKTYQERHGKKLTEIFLHYRSWMNKFEFEGFKEACPPGVN